MYFGDDNKKGKMIGRDLKSLPKLRKKDKIIESGAYRRDVAVPAQQGRRKFILHNSNWSNFMWLHFHSKNRLG